MRRESAYILRLWNDSKCDDTWRASIEDIRSKDVVRFSSLTKLAAYLAENKLQHPVVFENKS